MDSFDAENVGQLHLWKCVNWLGTGVRAKHNPRFLTAGLKPDWCRLLVSITGGDFITFRLWVRE